MKLKQFNPDMALMAIENGKRWVRPESMASCQLAQGNQVSAKIKKFASLNSVSAPDARVTGANKASAAARRTRSKTARVARMVGKVWF